MEENIRKGIPQIKYEITTLLVDKSIYEHISFDNHQFVTIN